MSSSSSTSSSLRKTLTIGLFFLAFIAITWTIVPDDSSSKKTNSRTEEDEDTFDDIPNIQRDLEKAIKKSKVASSLMMNSPSSSSLSKQQNPSSSSSSSSVSSSSTSSLFSPTSSSNLRYEYISQENVANSDLEKLRESCDIRDLERTAYYDEKTKTDSISNNGWMFRNWCAKYSKVSSPFPPPPTPKNGINETKQDKDEYETSFDSLPFRLDSDQLRALFNNQVTLFVGDSVVRNHFVLTMARMCNEKRRGKCTNRMPTYEYDVVRPNPATRGPLGCIPRGDENNDDESKTTKISEQQIQQEEEEKETKLLNSRTAQTLGRKSSSRRRVAASPPAGPPTFDDDNNNNKDDETANSNNKNQQPEENQPGHHPGVTYRDKEANNNIQDVEAAAIEARKKAEKVLFLKKWIY